MSRLKLYQTAWNAGMTDQNSLARAMQVKPDTVIPGVVFLLGEYYEKFKLSYLTKARGNVMYLEKSDEYDWNVMGSLDKAIAVLSLTSGGSTPGIAGSTFKVVFEEQWFGVGSIIFGDEKVQCRVQEYNGTKDGGHEYTLKLVDPDPDKYVPLTDLSVGKKWAQYYTAFEEFSRGGHSNSVAPTKVRNQITTLRMKKPISAHTRMHVAVFEFTAPGGRKVKYWLDWEEWLLMVQYYETVERAGWYSIYNRKANGTIDLPGQNGRPVLTGAGILQQCASGNSQTYTELSTVILDDVLGDASFNMLDADNRKFVGFSGEMGFVQLHQALEKKAREYTLIDTTFVAGNGQNLTLGGQFAAYKGKNGVEFMLTPNTIYDNPEKNTKEHPVSTRPLESYRITILDGSMYNGKPNLQAVSRKSNGVDRSLMRWHISGSVTPTEGAPGDFSSNSRASDVDGYELVLLSQCGYFLQNSRSCADMQCIIEA